MIQDRSCPFGAYSICNTNVTAKYMRSSTPMPACNHTEWQFLKAAGQLATVGNVSDACNVQLNKYCKVNGNFDKACQIVPKHCPAHTNGLPCSGHGNCNQLTAICTCDSAWYLDDCSNSTCPVSDFGDTDCNPPHGSCNKRIPICECAPGRYGTTCEFSTCPGNCSGHGSCVARTGQCVCNYPWSGAACDHWQWYVTPVVKHHSDQEYDMFDLDLRWWNITRWEYYTIEVNTNLTDTLSNQQFTITLMKERLGVYATEQYWDGKSYPTDHAFHRSISICPLDIATVDPRYNWKIGVKALPNTPYQLQFNVTKTLIPLDEDFIVETYGYRYLHIDHLPQHQANYTYMWLDIEILDGGFNSISVRPDTCPLEEHENSHLLKPKDWTRSTIFDTWGYIDTHTSSTVSNYTSGNSSGNSSTQTGREYNSTYAPSTQTNRYRLELWSCGAPTGTYFVAIDARAKYVKAKLRATIGVNDHRCQTIVPPMREEILVTFGEVVERSFPIVIGFVVFVFLLFLAVRYCIRQAAVSAAHRKRIDMVILPTLAFTFV